MKITLEAAAQYICDPGKSQTEYEVRLAALLRAAQFLIDVAGAPIQYLPILDGKEFLSCAVCGEDWLRNEPEQHSPECALVAFRKLGEGE